MERALALAPHLNLQTGLPAFGIAPAVEAGNYDNPMLLNLEEYCVGKASDTRPPLSSMDDWKLQRVLCDCLNGRFDCPCETLRQFRPYLLVPGASMFRLRIRFR